MFNVDLPPEPQGWTVQPSGAWYDTGMPADEARKIMDLAYNRQ